MNNLNKLYKDDNLRENLIEQGFRKLDSNLIVEKPPKIKWGPRYKESNIDTKLIYLENIASVMNHAAYLIQNERNKLLDLCTKKEQQLVAITKNIDANNLMVQSEVTRMNEDRQAFNAAVAGLNTRIRELEHGNLD